jgi:hypothetical protein
MPCEFKNLHFLSFIELLGRVRLGFLLVSPFELHVYSSMWSEAEALSEYGVVPECLILLLQLLSIDGMLEHDMCGSADYNGGFFTSLAWS